MTARFNKNLGCMVIFHIFAFSSDILCSNLSLTEFKHYNDIIEFSISQRKVGRPGPTEFWIEVVINEVENVQNLFWIILGTCISMSPLINPQVQTGGSKPGDS